MLAVFVPTKLSTIIEELHSSACRQLRSIVKVSRQFDGNYFRTILDALLYECRRRPALSRRDSLEMGRFVNAVI